MWKLCLTYKIEIKNLNFMPWSCSYRELLLLTDPPRANWNNMRENWSGAIIFFWQGFKLCVKTFFLVLLQSASVFKGVCVWHIPLKMGEILNPRSVVPPAPRHRPVLLIGLSGLKLAGRLHTGKRGTLIADSCGQSLVRKWKRLPCSGTKPVQVSILTST